MHTMCVILKLFYTLDSAFSR